ncbi:DUF4139 domain-containing protein [Dysgonomonas massiliensis]|uniref:DUF4139 domain-containing protein n=1 Tax=Dysgonomonas massiliensis TaxID=2040292 RepID=UPI000C7561D3|nr:DUF4139 domain-containing protein [Dysgonomonas massiliensis]
MKIKMLLSFLIIISSLSMKAQDTKEQKIKTEVSEATVFINGAQVLRKKTIYIPAGKSTLKFTDLSPYVDAKSIQIKLAGDAMVLGVNYQTNTEEVIKKVSAEKENELDKRLEEVTRQLVAAKTSKELIQDEIAFLNENKKIGGANTGISLLTLKETANYYRERMTALKTQQNEISKKISQLEFEQRMINNSYTLEGGDKPMPKGEVVVEIDAKRAANVNVELTYYVRNASWFPSYDIRSTSIDKPIELIYKANILQNTKEDWNNVKLSISSANPNLGTVAPRLRTYFLDYNVAPPKYDVNIDDNEIKGAVYDTSGEPLIGVSVMIKGTTIGTVTDVDGKFALAIPNNAREVEFSYVGFNKKILPISRSFMSVQLEESQQMLEEAVVVGYGSHLQRALAGSVAGVNVEKPKESSVIIRGMSSLPARQDIAMPTEVVENQTAVEFDVKIPYTIKSDNKNTIVEVERYALPADYEYYVVPKVSKNVFLLANITDWNQYNLLEGEANIFFENTYIGKTIIDTRSVTDTLSVSLGQDKSILVKREAVKENTSKKFLSNKREDTKSWKIDIRNNKNQPINLTVLDQVPVSRRDEIEVMVEDQSKGLINKETGEVKWNLKMKPSDKKELNLRYKVRYPSGRNLYIE